MRCPSVEQVEAIRSLPDGELQKALVEYGARIDPILCGPEEGYAERAKVILRKTLCPTTCEFLRHSELRETVEVAVAIAESFAKAIAGTTPVPSASLLCKLSLLLARNGLPAVLSCPKCPLMAESTARR